MLLFGRLLTERGVRHGFSTRNGGVSEGPFATLNAAVGPGDDPAAVAENLRRVAAAVGVAPAALFQTSQVHGVAVREIHSGDAREAVVREEADALVAREPGVAVGVRVADCVPILVHDARSGAVAAIHAGWRGLADGVIGAGVGALAADDPSGLVAAVGPSIGPCCFEVGEEVAERIATSVGDRSVIIAGAGKPHVDLRRAARIALGRLGLAADRIEDVPGCTMCEPERFHSFRRDGARSGRLIAVIVATTSSSSSA